MDKIETDQQDRKNIFCHRSKNITSKSREIFVVLNFLPFFLQFTARHDGALLPLKMSLKLDKINKIFGCFFDFHFYFLLFNLIHFSLTL